jgi:hypothetical protein
MLFKTISLDAPVATELREREKERERVKRAGRHHSWGQQWSWGTLWGQKGDFFCIPTCPSASPSQCTLLFEQCLK